MRRLQIAVDDDLDRALREAAAVEGRSAAAVVREALRRYLAADPVLAAVGIVDGLPAGAAAHHDRDLYGAARRGR